MNIPFLRSFSRHEGVHDLTLLPSPYATLLIQSEEVLLYGPHSKVWTVPRTQSAVILFLEPHFIKNIVGHTKYFINKAYTQQELPLLALFVNVFSEKESRMLLQDARDAVEITHNERQFEKVWRELTDGGTLAQDIAMQRQSERLCLRYAGQSPLMIIRENRLTSQLAVDIRTGRYTPIGQFADQSHYVRECRQLTGYTPRHWQKMSGTFYDHKGDVVKLKK